MKIAYTVYVDYGLATHHNKEEAANEAVSTFEQNAVNAIGNSLLAGNSELLVAG